MTDSSSTFAYSVLTRLLAYYESHQIAVKLAEPDEAAPYASLLIGFEEIGASNDSLLLEMSFVPGLDEFEEEGVYLLQTFAVLRDKTAPAQYEALLHTCASLNLTLPLGTFGVTEPGGALYFKHNAMLRSGWLENDQGLLHLDRTNGLVLHQFHQFMDQLTAEA
ncbi:hypothetical protein [Paenibacillus sp. NEAU-GSW1]|uniref:hypothetical protein n=1 Tax=Paenibacillus sp. NEAU-GSW1 TaxID=2682486 RepID=UPI0012E319CA|nr:hypothetical protein [Paenibacillus sp. NEAU-GSW1]MUT64673.1 hypothetical protein [Paenibacillus sp. NEAU-GSW1]